MGNDGGTINKVHKLRLSIEPDDSKSLIEQDLRQFQEASIWRCCRLSGQRLRLPIVSDCKGNLLNKESILEWLLRSRRDINEFSHIKRMDDVVELKSIKESGDGLICEFSGDEIGKSNVKFIYLTGCGDVLPKSSLGFNIKKGHCPKCELPYSDLDVIPLNPSNSELEYLRERMEDLERLNIRHNGKRKSTKRREARNGTINKTNFKRPRGPKVRTLGI